MIPGFYPPDAENDSERKLISDVKDYGWHVLNILPGEVNPPFSYSIGLYQTFGHPEILLMGLPGTTAHNIINVAADHIAKGKVFKPGDRSDELAEGFTCEFIPVNERHYREFVGYALWYYQPLKRSFPVIQLLWPDKQGRLPREEGYDASYLKFQRLLDVR